MRLFPKNPPQITDRAVRRAWSAVLVVVMLAAVGSMVGVVWLSHENDELAGTVSASKKDQAKITKRLDDQRDASATLAAQVELLGGTPAVTTDSGDVVMGPKGDRGPGPTPAQIRAGVDDWCSDGDRCKPPGPTRQQLVAAVAAHCAAGNCQGPRGLKGDKGDTGEQGPGVTAAQVSAGINTYCSNDSCRGPKGDTGDKGEKGDKGDKGDTGSVTPGTYACPDGQWVSAIDVAADGLMTLTCSPFIGRE